MEPFRFEINGEYTFMAHEIKLSQFINLHGMNLPIPGWEFPSNLFDLLGEKLLFCINDLLDRLDVSGSPVIKGKVSPQAHIEGPVYIAATAHVEAFAFIKGPAYIGPGSEIRHGAYIRSGAYIGKNCVVGHTTEVKGSFFFDGAKAAHFAYVGDSILGRDVNLGAGTKLANLKLKHNEIFYEDPHSGKKLGSGLRKWGSMIGDSAQTGCNSVLSPGTLLYPKTSVLPCTHFKGTLRPS
jgi:NDP-sugar pyrophosphorylase family protein